MKKRRTLFWIAVAVVMALLGAGLFVFYVDEAPPPDGDLRLAREEVPAAENGFRSFETRPRKIELAMYQGDAEEPFGKGWDGKVAEEVLEKNGEVLKEYDRCLALPKFQVPGPPGFDEGNTDPFWFRSVGRLVAVRAALHFEDGKEREAFAETLGLLRFAAKLEASGGGMVYLFRGLRLKGLAAGQLIRMLERTKLAREELRPFFEGLLEYRVRDEIWADACGADYCRAAAFVDDLARGKVDLHLDEQRSTGGRFLRFILKPNQTRRFMAEAHRSLRDGRDDSGRRASDPWWTPLNVVGKELAGPTQAAAGGLWLVRRRGDLSIIIPHVLFALKCFQAAQGRVPQSLSELVPEYLKEVPADPFDGKPIRYSAPKKLLYSVGSDRIDSGGIGAQESDSGDADDLTFQIDV